MALAVGSKNLLPANALPFAHAVNAARDAISGNYSDIMPELIPVCGYAVVLLVLAVVVFSVMMKIILSYVLHLAFPRNVCILDLSSFILTSGSFSIKLFCSFL